MIHSRKERTMDFLTCIAIVVFIAGFILLAIEIMLPGFSAPGTLGIICLIVGVFLAADSFLEGVIITLIVLALLGIMFAVLLSLLSSGKLKSPIILEEEQKSNAGYISSNDLNYLLGKEGIAVTDLRPSGVGDFDGVEFDIISEGKYIEKDTPLVIAKVEGSKLVVKKR